MISLEKKIASMSREGPYEHLFLKPRVEQSAPREDEGETKMGTKIER